MKSKRSEETGLKDFSGPFAVVVLHVTYLKMEHS